MISRICASAKYRASRSQAAASASMLSRPIIRASRAHEAALVFSRPSGVSIKSASSGNCPRMR
jgi:hypothetical protein